MIAARSGSGVLRAGVALLVANSALATAVLAAGSPPPRQIVVRVSRDAVAPFADMQIDTTTPVEDVILGTYVRGKARTTARPAIEFVANPNQATFAVLLKGATVSRTVGRNGPATIYTRADTHFTATTQVRFEPGRGFVAQPARIAATTRSMNEGIGTQRGGLIGWIVHRRASRRVAESQTAIEVIARQKAERRITAAFDDYLRTRLARLNEMTDVQPAIALVLGREGEPKFLSRTTRHYLEIAVGTAHAPEQIMLPAMTAQADAPFQLFVHNSIVGQRVAGALKLLDATDGKTNFAERALWALPDVLRTRLGVPELSIRTGPNLDYRTSDDWIVVSIGGQGAPDLEVLVATEQPRVWTSADGRYRCYAEKVDATEESVTLKRMNDGQVVTVPLVRLSAADREVVLR